MHVLEIAVCNVVNFWVLLVKNYKKTLIIYWLLLCGNSREMSTFARHIYLSCTIVHLHRNSYLSSHT